MWSLKAADRGQLCISADTNRHVLFLGQNYFPGLVPLPVPENKKVTFLCWLLLAGTPAGASPVRWRAGPAPARAAGGLFEGFCLSGLQPAPVLSAGEQGQRRHVPLAAFFEGFCLSGLQPAPALFAGGQGRRQHVPLVAYRQLRAANCRETLGPVKF